MNPLLSEENKKCLIPAIRACVDALPELKTQRVIFTSTMDKSKLAYHKRHRTASKEIISEISFNIAAIAFSKTPIGPLTIHEIAHIVQCMHGDRKYGSVHTEHFYEIYFVALSNYIRNNGVTEAEEKYILWDFPPHWRHRLETIGVYTPMAKLIRSAVAETEDVSQQIAARTLKIEERK